MQQYDMKRTSSFPPLYQGGTPAYFSCDSPLSDKCATKTWTCVIETAQINEKQYYLYQGDISSKIAARHQSIH